jgi:hypothetical protein
VRVRKHARACVQLLTDLSVFTSNGQISLSLRVKFDLIVTDRMFLLFGGELDDGHCDALLPVEVKEKFKYFQQIIFVAG